MTTAARPTWAPAKGGNEQGGTRIFGPSQKYSFPRHCCSHNSQAQLDPHGHLPKVATNKVVLEFLALLRSIHPETLLLTQLSSPGQDTQDELQKRNLREELEERERRHFSSKDKSYYEDRDRRKGSNLLLEGTKGEIEDRIAPRSVDADDSDVDHKNDNESDDDDDDEDDTEALLAELEQIKKERAEEQLHKEKQQQEEELKAKEAELLRGNPLLNNPASFNVKRRWDDDVVFKNQARGETKAPKRFINDTIQNDFHRKFLQKYMK